MKKSIGMMFMACAFVCTAEAFTVNNVSAAARWPWNGVLDVDFNIEGAAVGDLFRVEVKAKYAEGTKTLVGRTYVSEPLCSPGKNRVSWDARADHPELNIKDMQIAVTVHPVNADACDVYMVIDLSSGPNSSRYPVRYTFTPPNLAPADDLAACAKDPCRTTQMWFKRIKGNTFPFGGTNNNNGEGDFKVRLSPYYIGIFEVTQQQWAQVMDAWPAKFTNVTWRAARPVENINYEDVIGHNNYPEDKTVSENSFVGKMRARTGIEAFNLPTEAQWECACRAGYAKSFNSDFSSTDIRFKLSSADLTYNEDTATGTAIVGTYKANKWGLYNMYGNVMEMCLDAYAGISTLKDYYATLYGEGNLVLDPTGPATCNATKRKHSTRGGCWYNSDIAYFYNYYRSFGDRDNTGKRHHGVGARFAIAP